MQIGLISFWAVCVRWRKRLFGVYEETLEFGIFISL